MGCANRLLHVLIAVKLPWKAVLSRTYSNIQAGQRRLALAVVLLLLTTSLALAQSTSQIYLPLVTGGSEPSKLNAAEILTGSPISSRTTDQIRPAIAYNRQMQEYLVVWEDKYTPSNHDIYGQRVSADGAGIGNEFSIANFGDTEQNPSIIYNLTLNEYLVGWERVAASGQHSVRAQRVSSIGGRIGPELTVEPHCALWVNSECRPQVTYNTTDNEYLVIWADSTSAECCSAWGQLISGSGTLLGNPVHLAYASNLYYPTVVHNSVDNDYLFVWTGNSDSDVYAQVFDRWLAPLFTNKTIVSSASNYQIEPQIALNSQKDEYLVVWADHRRGEGSYSDIYGQLLDSSGQLRGNNFLISKADAYPCMQPDLIYNQSANEYIVAWEYKWTDSDHDVYLQRLAPSGSLEGSEVAISKLLTYEGHPVLATNGQKTYLIIWEDGRNSVTQGIDLYADRAYVNLLSGHVYAGNVGDQSQPLAGVTVGLYCALSTGELGTLQATTTTNNAGLYELILGWGWNCDYMHILETDPSGYESVNAVSTGGRVVSANQVRYLYPAGNLTLTGNDFWDKPTGPIDDKPPIFLPNFSPSGWVNIQTVNASVGVQDTSSGLAIASAQYAYSKDGGNSWSGWLPASCTGANGTKEPQTLTAANVPFGQDAGVDGVNRIKFSIKDIAQPTPNQGNSAVFTIAIDTVPPQNPALLTCPSHTVGVWSNLSQIMCEWSAGSDQGSGLVGYAYKWDHVASTIPTIIPTTPNLSITSHDLPEGFNWYFHLRAIDKAGNAAPSALHQGPYALDSTPPSSSVASLAAVQETGNFLVSWSGDPGAGSPIDGYDIKVIDQFAGGIYEFQWESDTMFTAETFPSERGHTYSFSSRARDKAGNLEDYPLTADTVTTIGKDVTVRVSGVTPPGTKVFQNGRFIGLTNGNGQITVPSALLGDELLALHKIYEKPAAKANHSLDGSKNWAWRVYHTSFDFSANGTPQPFRVTDLDHVQDLVIKWNQTLIGMHIVVSVEWDADSAYLDDLAQGLRNASDYLYDVGDGQFFWEVIEVFDDGERWGDADMRFMAVDKFIPSAKVWGITTRDGHMNFGRIWAGGWTWNGSWQKPDGFRTMIHEFGHYGLGLWDEYLDRNGNKKPRMWSLTKINWPDPCGTNFLTVVNPPLWTDQEATSIMDYQYQATELCSNVDPNHKHEKNTEHDRKTNGETTWDTVVRRFNDPNGLWTLLRPDDRGAILAGPNLIPMSDAVQVSMHDHDTGVCAPFNMVWVDTDDGAPAGSAEIRIDRPNQRDLYQGKTDAQGAITVIGAHNGDTARLYKDTGWFSSWSGSEKIVCNGTDASAAGPITLTVPIKQSPFSVEILVLPLSGNQIQIEVKSSAMLAENQVVELWQDGATNAVVVSLVYDARRQLYIGQSVLDGSLDLAGYTRLIAVDQSSQTVHAWMPFHLEPIVAGEFNDLLYSTDGNFRLTLPENSLSGNAILAIQENAGASAVQDTLVRVSSAYWPVLSSGSLGLQAPAKVHIDCSSGQLENVKLETVKLYRWDETANQWILVGGTLIDGSQTVSADVDRLSTFAVLGERRDGFSIYLPVIIR